MLIEKGALIFKRDEIISFAKQFKEINERLEYFLYVFNEIKIIQEILKRKFFYNFVVKKIIEKNPNLNISSPHVTDYMGQDTVSRIDMNAFREWINNVRNEYLANFFGKLVESKAALKYDNFINLEEEIIRNMDNLRAIISIEINHIRELMRLKNDQKKSTTENSRNNLEQDKIKWNGTDSQLVYLFDLLFKNDLLSESEYHDEQYSLISKYFKSKSGQNLTEPMLKVSAKKVYDGTLNKKQIIQIDKIVDQTKNLK